MNMPMRIGAIYAFYYLNWKTNIKVYAFIFYAGPQSQYVHALNIGANQLNSYDRIRIVMTIKKLAALNSSTFFNGRLLYTIFKKYLFHQIKKCYRTYNKQYIQRVALINYGLNNPSEFSIEEMQQNNNTQYAIAQRDLVIKIMNLYTKKGTKLSDFRNQFAVIKPVINNNEEINSQKEDETAIKDKPNIISGE